MREIERDSVQPLAPPQESPSRPGGRGRRRVVTKTIGALFAVAMLGWGMFLGLNRLLGERDTGFVNSAPLPPGPVTATAERDGVVVTLTFEKRHYAPGEVAWAELRVANTGATPALYFGGCGKSFSAAAHPAVFDRPGREWSGEFKALKEQLLKPSRYTNSDDEAGLWGYSFWGPKYVHANWQVRSDLSFECASTIASVESIPPGGIEEFRVGWDTTPGPPGRATVSASFQYLGRPEDDPEAKPPDYFPFHGKDREPIRAEVEIELIGKRRAMISPAEAVDVVLEDGRLMRWEYLNHPDAAESGVHVDLADEAWVVGGYTMEDNDDDTEHSISALVDAESGRLFTVTRSD